MFFEVLVGPRNMKTQDLLQESAGLGQTAIYYGQVGNVFFPPCNYQLMVNCLFGLVVWDSRGTPK